MIFLAKNNIYRSFVGNRVDFDNWAASGATGWSYKEVLPYFKKSEDNQDPDIAYNGYHGRGGLMNVKRTPYKSPMAYTFLEAGKSLGKSNSSNIFLHNERMQLNCNY